MNTNDVFLTDVGVPTTERDLFDQKFPKSDENVVMITINENDDTFNYSPSQRELLVQILDYEIKLENALFLIYYSPALQNINAVLDIIATDDNNKVRHPYISPNGGGLCTICDLKEDKHFVINANEKTKHSIFYEKITKILTDTKKREEIIKEIRTVQEKKNCQICFADVYIHNIFHMNHESHEICIPCLKEYLTQDIIIGKVVEMKCPHCFVLLPEQEIQKHVDGPTHAKFIKFLNQNRINTDPLSRWCPNPTCSQVVRLSKKTDSKATCSACGMNICALCNREDHPNMGCTDIMNKELKDWSAHRDVSRCPKCRVLVEKETGCNHMSCQLCAYEWCWLCGAAYTSIHYLPMNPLGCPGLQSGGFKAKRWGCGRICLWRMFVLFLIILAFPIYIAIGPSLIFFFCIIDTNCWRRKFRNRRKCRKFTGVFLIVLLTLLLTPLLIAINLVALLPLILIAIVMYIKERRKMTLRSKQRLASLSQAATAKSV